MSERCDECGFDYDALPRHALSQAITTLAAGHAERLRNSETAELQRKRGPTWSALEYACHVRDVLEVQRARILLAQREDTPAFEPMRRDERPTELRYNAQPPGDTAAAVETNAAALAETLDQLDDTGWQRRGIYSWPVRRPRTMEWVARNTVHELTHHLLDVDRALGQDQGPMPPTRTTRVRTTNPGGGSGIGGNEVPGPT